jgi:hypothetical protein
MFGIFEGLPELLMGVGVIFTAIIVIIVIIAIVRRGKKSSD